MDEKQLFLGIEKILRDSGFKKKGKLRWNMDIDDKRKWVIEFQKGKRATKCQYDMTINVGVYLVGTGLLIFGRENEFVYAGECFFEARPPFFGCLPAWWDFNLEGDNSPQIESIQILLQDKILPFLYTHRSYDSLLAKLPIKKWEDNTNFHSELLRVGVGYYLLDRIEEAKKTLQCVIDGGTIWAEKATNLLSQIERVS